MIAPLAYRRPILALTTAFVLVLSACGGAGTPPPSAAAPTATVAAATVAPGMAYTPANSVPQAFVWSKAPAAYPAGAEIQVLEGDLTKPVPFTLRFRFPDGYALPPHQHPIEEHVTVLQGSFVIGMGTSGNRETAIEMPAGSFILIPSLTKHYVFAKGVTIVQVHGVGPTGIAYDNPADDPRK
ncbi:MAG: cupin domain-containing protein [Chloroflexota bacterium]|nr:cupin domain-containing protein [Chloroflexota bacterium]